MFKAVPPPQLPPRRPLRAAAEQNHYALNKRLANAAELARCVRRLHAKGFIIGDIAYDNMILDHHNWALYLIDVDGAAFKHGSSVYPLKSNNAAKGTVSPPEQARVKDYTQQMDCWSLSVVLFNLLCLEDPIDFFGWARKCKKAGFCEVWPPQGDSQTPNIEAKVKLLGEPLREAFLLSFNAGLVDANKRLTAEKWEKLLDQARFSVYSCGCHPTQLFVSLDGAGLLLTKCPYCSATIAQRTNARNVKHP
jgi:DNA-binding helix-hairpin-helix protein with protein kinase domain